MTTASLPSRQDMIAAFLDRDPAFEGVFYTGVRTTGIFCRPTCPARKPRPDHVDFFPSAREALFAGYRPCKRCRPLAPAGAAPEWLAVLLDRVDEEPLRRWTDEDVAALGVAPERVRRWFRKHHGLTFQAFLRGRRLGAALRQIQDGEGVLETALDHGYESLSGFNEAFRRLTGTSPTGARGSRAVALGRIPTPLGPMVAAATDRAVCFLEFSDRRMFETQLQRMVRRLDATPTPGGNPVLARLAGELEEYFAGRRRSFSAALETPGTPFQEAVWARLLEIPSGTTRSYGEIAAELGRPGASRAVARAVGDNRIAILIPCHRVIGSDGSLTGYGGGLWRKKRLLEIEAGARIHGDHTEEG